MNLVSNITPSHLRLHTHTAKMGKRPISDLVAEGDATTKIELSRKKSKKDKKEKSKKSTTVDASASNGHALEHDINENGGEAALEEEKLSKAEQKAAKLAKKEAKEAKKAKNVGQDANTAVGEDEDAAKAARKAARKAEKKRLKESAEAEDAPSSKPSTAPTPKILSKTASSATIHQPTAATGSYEEDKELTKLPQVDIDAFLKENVMSIEDPRPAARKLRPITHFKYLPITDESQRAPFASFSAPTPIQAATWPFLFSGRDMIGVAETGSGKTLAFGVPCVRYITSLPKDQRRGIKAVIVSPTRELAVQIFDQLVALATPAGLNAVCVYGGVPKDPQVAACKKAHIVVATPGRLNDLIGDGSADLSKAEYVVLDEADRMLDKGFEEPIRQIISQTAAKEKRQTLMFTATWPPSVRELAATFMKQPVRITIGDNASGELRANVRIKQLVEVLDPRDKDQRLIQLLKQYQSGKNKDDRILVFCLYKKEAMRVENTIRMRGFRVGGIHGDLSQEKRSASLAAFKEGQVPLLVATDVAARGLDIPAVKLVINMTFPLTVEDYVHRIGRTGRAGKEGLAITFFTEHDKGLSGSYALPVYLPVLQQIANTSQQTHQRAQSSEPGSARRSHEVRHHG